MGRGKEISHGKLFPRSRFRLSQMGVYFLLQREIPSKESVQHAAVSFEARNSWLSWVNFFCLGSFVLFFKKSVQKGKDWENRKACLSTRPSFPLSRPRECLTKKNKKHPETSEKKEKPSRKELLGWGISSHPKSRFVKRYDEVIF